METYNVSHPEFLWRPFYKGLIEDLSSILHTDVGLEMAILRHMEYMSRGQDLYLKWLPKIGKLLEAGIMGSRVNFRNHVPEYLIDAKSHLPKFFCATWQALFASQYGDPLGHTFVFRFDIRDRGKTNEDVTMAEFLAFGLRQYCLAFAKVEDVEPDVDTREELNSFAKRISMERPITLNSRVLAKARSLLQQVLCDNTMTHQTTSEWDLSPSLEQWISNPFGAHGPGAVAGGEKGESKWDFHTVLGVDPGLYSYWPRDYSEALAASGDPRVSALADEISEKIQNRCSKVCLVPKDFRKHRIICIEPKELQFAQQGLMRVLYKHIMSHPLTKRSINFVDQGRSQTLARSLNMATLDLADASDTLSLDLGRILLPRRFFKLVTRYRCNTVDIDGDITAVNALATMGNALCFPLETLIFWAISLATMLDLDRISLDELWMRDGRLNGRLLSRYPLRVFGDDIIVPRRYAYGVIANLEACGLIVNEEKSAVTSLGREACGAWYFNQADVRIVRFKSTLLRSASDWLAVLEYGKFFTETFGPRSRTAISILEHAQEFHPVPWDQSVFPKQFRILSNVRLCSPFYRWNEDYQRLEFWMPSLQKAATNRILRRNFGLYAYFTDSATKAVSLGDQQLVVWDWSPVC